METSGPNQKYRTKLWREIGLQGEGISFDILFLFTILKCSDYRGSCTFLSDRIKLNFTISDGGQYVSHQRIFMESKETSKRQVSNQRTYLFSVWLLRTFGGRFGCFTARPRILRLLLLLAALSSHAITTTLYEWFTNPIM